jgi:hypothetical protein
MAAVQPGALAPGPDVTNKLLFNIRTVYEIIWKNIVDQVRPQMSI